MRISDCSSYVCSSDLLGWPDGAREDQVPSWLVFSGMIRTVAVRAAEPGARPFRGALDELGFEDIDAGGIIAGFGRHLKIGRASSRERVCQDVQLSVVGDTLKTKQKHNTTTVVK